MSKKNIRYQMCRELEGKIRLGSNKRAAERDNNGTSQYIHSAQTARTYMQQTRQFGDWLRERGMGYCSIDEARQHAADYVREQKVVIVSTPHVPHWQKHSAALATIFASLENAKRAK